MNYISNAFSLQMITKIFNNSDMVIPVMKKIDPKEIPTNVVSAMGHADTAAVVSGILGRTIEFNRISISLEPGDRLYVAQITGGRLPEGCRTLPPGFEIEFYEIDLMTPEEEGSLASYLAWGHGLI